jgi:hypothetical protein
MDVPKVLNASRLLVELHAVLRSCVAAEFLFCDA